MEVKQSTRILEAEGYTNANGVAYILMRTSTFAFSLIFFLRLYLNFLGRVPSRNGL